MVALMAAGLSFTPMLIAGGVMILVGGVVVIVIVASRQLLKLKHRLRRDFKDGKFTRLQRQKMPVYACDGTEIEIETSKYFEPVELSAFVSGSVVGNAGPSFSWPGANLPALQGMHASA